MNQKPKNKTIFTPLGRAELFFQVVNCDHIMSNFRKELELLDDEKRFHDVSFIEIAKMLSGDVVIEKVPKSKTDKYYAISFYKNRYYYTIFYLDKRQDCETLFAIIVTCYATNKREIKEKYNGFLSFINKKYPNSSG